VDDVKQRVRRELNRLEPSPGGFEKTIQRARRHQRTRRLGAATLGLTLTAALVVGVWTLIRLGPQPSQPVSPPPPPANGPIWFEVTGKGQDSDSGVWEIKSDGSGLHKVLDFSEVNYWEIAWSTQATRIAYVDFLVGHYGIYTSNPDGTRALRLTDGADDGSPSWSPDGTKIAFSSSGPGQRDCKAIGDDLCTTDIYVMDADGSHITQLTEDPAADYQPAWSPDGTRITFARTLDAEMGAYAVYVMNSDGSGATLLTTDAGSHPHPSWSPDGTQITFVGHEAGSWGVYRIDADGGNGRLVALEAGSFTEGPVWSPDGTKIAFVSDRGGVPVLGCGTDGLCPPQIYVVNPDGTELERVTTMPEGVTGIAWRPLPAPSA
jgi:Tol biopolymer transport system component